MLGPGLSPIASPWARIRQAQCSEASSCYFLPLHILLPIYKSILSRELKVGFQVMDFKVVKN